MTTGAYVTTRGDSYIAGAALAKHRRVRLSSGKLAYGSDTQTDWIGCLENETFADGDAGEVTLRNCQGTIPMVASEAINAGVSCYAAANGKVASTGTVLVGVTKEAASGDGSVIEVIPSASAVIGDVARDGLAQDDLAVYDIPLDSWGVTGTLAKLGASAGTPSGALGITAGTHGSAAPKLVAEAASGASVTNKCRTTFTLPPEYVAGETITLRVICEEAVGAATVSTTIDAEVHSNDDDGTVSADICATGLADVTETIAAKDFTITPTGLEPGDQLDVELTVVSNDTGGTVGTVATIYRTQMLLDIKG